MPEYLAPGVIVEEVSFRARSIEGVGTSVAAVVGPTRTGPLRGTPEVVTSFAEYVRTYGDMSPLTLGGTQVANHTAIAAKSFFDNGGKQLFVARVTRGVNDTEADGSGSTADFGGAADAGNDLVFASRFPGTAGNYALELNWRDRENLLKVATVTAAQAGKSYYLQATGVPSTAKGSGSLDDARFPIDVRAIVELHANGTDYSIKSAKYEAIDNAAASVTGAAQLTRLVIAELPENATLTEVYAKQPTDGPLAASTPAEIRFTEETDLSVFTKVAHWGTSTTLRGTLDAAGTEFTADKDLNPGVDPDLSFELAALAASSDTVSAIVVLRSFDLDVRTGGKDGEVIYSFGGISTDPAASNSLDKVMPAQPAKRYDQLTQPVACTVAAADQEAVMEALYDLFDSDALNPTDTLGAEPRYLIELSGGDDGEMPTAVDYGGESDEVKGSTGFSALEGVEDISIVMTPAATVAGATTHQAVVLEMQKHCQKMRYRVGIVDSREGMSLSEVRQWRSQFDDSRLALYYPWVTIADPTGGASTLNAPPAGFVAGVYANTDVKRGVHKPPANEPVLGALGFAQEVNRFQQELLNPNGVNCLRSFPGRGHRVWGGRTMSSDPEWIYVNVRRYFLYLERSIEKSTQWVVFEPNGELLWASVRTAVEDFLYNEWFNGRLLGASPKAAYFVRCDRSTMTQNDLDYGRLVCVVGVAPLKPAEFVIFRIGQKTADAQA